MDVRRRSRSWMLGWAPTKDKKVTASRGSIFFLLSPGGTRSVYDMGCFLRLLFAPFSWLAQGSCIGGDMPVRRELPRPVDGLCLELPWGYCVD